jgi:hypothetical protein
MKRKKDTNTGYVENVRERSCNDTIQDFGTISKILIQYEYGSDWNRTLRMTELHEREFD